MRKSLKVVAFGGDPADTFLKAAGITDATITSAVKTLVRGLQADGLWSKMKAIYPMVGGNATAHSYNLKDPTKYKITWNGGLTHDSNGVKGNGTNGYGNLNLKSNDLTSQSSFGTYCRINDVSVNSAFEFGATELNGFEHKLNPHNFGSIQYIHYRGFGNEISTSNSSTNAFFHVGLDTSNNLFAYKNTSLLQSKTPSTIGTGPSINIYLLGYNSNGTASNFSARSSALFFAANGITQADNSNLYTRIQTFQTTLNRFVGTPIYPSFDSDAQSFMTSASITDSTQQAAVNYLVTDLKSNNLWTKMKALYPMVGGTATSHSYNLKNPAQYQISFSGGWTHSSTGALPNGTTGYGNTNFNDSLLTANNSHLSYYSRTNANTATYDMGLYSSVLAKGIWMTLRDNSNRFGGGIFQAGSAGELTVTNLDSKGFYIGGKNGSNVVTFYKNGSNVVSGAKTDTTATNSNLFLATLNSDGSPAFGYSNKECAFASIGDGLSDAEASTLYTITQNYQTILSRNI